MLAIISLLVVLVLSLLITRTAAVALQLTGMSREAARFQASSAYTGAGFTTSESEQVIGHPVRRRIMLLLMMMGNLGLVAGSGTLILSFIGLNDRFEWSRAAVLVVGFLAIYKMATSKVVDSWVCALIRAALSKYTTIETRDFSTLLHLRGDYRVAEVHVRETDWMAGRAVESILEAFPDMLVLGVELANGEYVGAPHADRVLKAGQTLIVYGLPDEVESLDCRCGEEHGSDAEETGRVNA